MYRFEQGFWLVRPLGRMSTVIRLAITIGLVYGAYLEAGIFTALSLLFIFASIEWNGILSRMAIENSFLSILAELKRDT